MTTIIILSIIFLVIDQISKILIIKLLEPNEVITIIKNFFYIIYTNNTGAAFSILLGKRIFLIVVAILIIGILLYYIKKSFCIFCKGGAAPCEKNFAYVCGSAFCRGFFGLQRL